MYSTVVTICTASLTFSNSTFCPHSVFMCFVWISEQTAIISLYNINWLVFVTETESVYCSVRTGCSNTTEVQLGCCSAPPASSAHSSRCSSALCRPSLVPLPVLSLRIKLGQQALPVLSAFLHQMSDDPLRGGLLSVAAFLTACLQSIRESFCNKELRLLQCGLPSQFIAFLNCTHVYVQDRGRTVVKVLL